MQALCICNVQCTTNPSQMDSGARALKLMTGSRCWPGSTSRYTWCAAWRLPGWEGCSQVSWPYVQRAVSWPNLSPLCHWCCRTWAPQTSQAWIDSSPTAEGMRSSSMNASVTSRNALHLAHTIFFPLPEKHTVSHPVKSWKIGRLWQYLESIVAISSWISMHRRCDPVPRITHTSSGLILSNEATASSNKSVSTVRMLILLLPFRTASAAWRIRCVSAFSYEHRTMLLTIHPTLQESGGHHFHGLYTVIYHSLVVDKLQLPTGRQTFLFCSHVHEGILSSSLSLYPVFLLLLLSDYQVGKHPRQGQWGSFSGVRFLVKTGYLHTPEVSWIFRISASEQ